MLRKKKPELNYLAQAVPEFSDEYAEELAQRFGVPSVATLDLRITNSGDVGAAINVLQETVSWVVLQFQSQLLTRLRSTAPELFFDVEKKFEFTALMSAELAAFSRAFLDTGIQLQTAIEAQNDELAEKYSQQAIRLVLAFLNQMRKYVNDFQHFATLDAWNNYQDKLGRLKVDDRRTLDVFFTQFMTSFSTVRRVVNNEVQGAIDNQREVSVRVIFAWLGEVTGAIKRMRISAERLIDS